MTTETAIPSFLGAPVQRREDPALITGMARYIDAITPTGTLHLAIGRSPLAHAVVTSIDIEAVDEVPLCLGDHHAADLVFVDYEPLDVIGDMEEALEAPPIHPEFESNVAYDRSKGDREAFESVEGPIRLSGAVEHPRVAPAPMENRAILAEWMEDGLKVHLSSEAGAIGSTPAVVNAVADALGSADVQIPVTPEQI